MKTTVEQMQKTVNLIFSDRKRKRKMLVSALKIYLPIAKNIEMKWKKKQLADTRKVCSPKVTTE